MSNNTLQTSIHPTDSTPLLHKHNKKTPCKYLHDDNNESQPSPPRFESLDFDRTINTYTISDAKSNPRYLQITITRWVLVALVGFSTGITAVIIVHCVDKLVEFRVSRLNEHMQDVFGSYSEDEMSKYYSRHRVGRSYLDNGGGNFSNFGKGGGGSIFWKHGVGGIYAFYILYNVALVVLSTTLCVCFAPMAVGSGLPEVKAYLNGVRVGKFSGPRLYFIKLLGTILGVASGLVVGPEGPIVHLGAILGASLTKTKQIEEWFCSIMCRDIGTNSEGIAGFRNEFGSTRPFDGSRSVLSFFRNDLERRHLISIGAAAGFSSAFGAPVGGLLYSMEEASSFFTHDMLWKTLTATCIATFCIAFYYGSLTRYSMLSLEIGTVDSSLTHLKEIPIYFVLGTIGGIVGSAFNRMNAFMNNLRKLFYEKIRRKWEFLACKVFESAFLSIFTSFVFLTAVLLGKCRVEEKEDERFQFIHRYNCPPGHISELGSLLFGSREESIRDILTDPEDFAPATLLTIGVLVFGLMVITFGVALPTGMFMPSILTGSSLGGFAGLVIKRHYISSIHPSDFALIGAASFLAGSQRNIVSLCVILMEGTGNTKTLIPVIITVVCARTVGGFLSEGIYEELMELRGYPFLKHEAKPQYDVYTARDVMSDAVSIDAKTDAGIIEDVLMRTPYNAFPVVEKGGCYLGMVRRDQLIAALENKVYIDLPDVDGDSEDSSANNSDYKDRASISSLRRQVHVDDGLYRSVAEWRPLIERTSSKRESKLSWVGGKIIITIPTEERLNSVDVGSMMNKCAISVQEDTPLSRVFDVYTCLGLRHLPVVSNDGSAVGVITRFNLSDDFIRHIVLKSGVSR